MLSREPAEASHENSGAGQVKLSLMLPHLNVPYHLEVAGTHWGFAPKPGSTFTPTTVPWPVSVPMDPTAAAEFFRVVEGATVS
jgi:hypothetical protein